MLFGHYYDCGCKLSQNPNKPSHFPNDSFSFPRPPSLMGLILLILLTLLTLLKSLALLTAWKECVTLYITSPTPMVPWWGSFAGSSIGRSDCVAPFYNTHFLHFEHCVCCLCICVYLCVCVLYLCVCVCVCGDHCVNESNGLRLGGSSLQEGLPRPPQSQMLGTLRSQ